MREALERQWAAERLAARIICSDTADCEAKGSGSVQMQLAARLADVARLESSVAELSVEKESLLHQLEAAERRADDERRRADAATAELRVLRISAPVAVVPSALADLDVAGKAAPAEPAEDHAGDSVNVSGTTSVGCGGPVLAPRAHVEAIRLERLRGMQSPVMRDMFLGCIDLLSSDIYASRSHFVEELLQNADDNDFPPEHGVEPTAYFRVHPGDVGTGEAPYILVANNELGMSQADVAGLCAISKSCKVGRMDRTGRKGIGFKSVFGVSTCPHVLSGPYTFKFDVRENRLGYVTPTWVEDFQLATLPRDVRDMYKRGFTCVYLPLDACGGSSGLLAEVDRHLESLDLATLLFLRRLRRIDMFLASGAHRTLEFGGTCAFSPDLSRESVRVRSELASMDGVAPARADELYEFLVARSGPTDARGSSIGIVLPLCDPHLGALPLQRAFATLPVCHTGMALAINADWDLSASRDGVHENEQNDRLASAAAALFAKVAKQACERLQPWSALHYVGEHPPLQRFWRRAREAFFRELLAADVPCVPVESDGESIFAPASSVVRRPGPGASEVCRRAADMVDGAAIRRSGKWYAKEPLPAGVRLELFGLVHFIGCLPHLVEQALSGSAPEAPAASLESLYDAFAQMLGEVPQSGATPVEVADRVRIGRSAAVFPVRLRSGGVAFCALDTGPIFAVEAECKWFPSRGGGLVPMTASEVARPGRLRICVDEVCSALTPSLRCRFADLGLHVGSIRPEHLFGLCAELHERGEEAGEEDPDIFWASLQLLRDALGCAPDSLGGGSVAELFAEGGCVLDGLAAREGETVDEEATDVLAQQGRALLRAPRGWLARLLFVPSAGGALRHPGALICPSFLGVPVGITAAAIESGGPDHSALVLAELPPILTHGPPSAVQLVLWERFFVQLLGMRPAVSLMHSDSTAAFARSVTERLFDPDWWCGLSRFGVAAKFVADAIEEHADVLQRLQVEFAEGGSWLVREFFAADFAHFFEGVLVDGKRPPVLPQPIREGSRQARASLLRLGVAMNIDEASLVDRCLPLLAGTSTTARPENFASAYAALGRCGCAAPSLAASIFVPSQGMVHASACLFLPEGSASVAALVGKFDLGPLYPGLRSLFVDRLGVQATLQANGCLVALRELRARGADVAANEAFATATAVYRMLASRPSAELELAGVREAVEAEELFLATRPPCVPPIAGDGSSEESVLRWVRPGSCIWHDVPAGLEARRPSVERWYAAELRSFIVDVLGVADLDVDEVIARLKHAGAAASCHGGSSPLHLAYESVDDFLVAHGAGGEVGGQATSLLDELVCALRRVVRWPAAVCLSEGGAAQPRATSAVEPVFLAGSAGPCAERVLGRVNIGANFPGLREFFVRRLGVCRPLGVSECLGALRELRAFETPLLPEMEAGASRARSTAVAILEVLAEQNERGTAEFRDDLCEVFADEPLLLVGAVESSARGCCSAACTADGSPLLGQRWLRSSECMWEDVASAAAPERRRSLARFLPQHLRSLLVGTLGVPAADAEEVFARIARLTSAAVAVLGPGSGGGGCSEGAGCHELTALRRAYEELEAAVSNAEAAELRGALAAVSGIALPREARVVPLGECVYLARSGAPSGGMDNGVASELASLVGLMDIRTGYPTLGHCFLDCFALPPALSIDQLLAALRALRQRTGAAIGGTGDGGSDAASADAAGAEDDFDQHNETLRLAAEAYRLLGEAAGRGEPRVVDVLVTFEEEPLLFSRTHGCRWLRSSECTWYDVPRAPLVHVTPLEKSLDADLRHTLVEVLGIVAIHAGEVSARLDGIFTRHLPPSDETTRPLVAGVAEECRGGGRAVAFAAAFLELEAARREADGVEFYNADLVAVLRERIYAPALGILMHCDCMWPRSQSGGAVAALADKHDLREAWGDVGLDDDALRTLRHYFVDWLGVAEGLRPLDCLDALRACRKVRSAGEEPPGFSLVDRVRLVYCELANALVHVEDSREPMPGASPDQRTSAEALREAFRKEALLLVPGDSRATDRWLTAEQCIWVYPEHAPEGWRPAHSQLEPCYGSGRDGALIRRLLTEHLGVPMSVRFTLTASDRTVVPLLPEQPFWLFVPQAGARMVPWSPADAYSGAREEAPAQVEPKGAKASSGGGGDVQARDLEVVSLPPQIAAALAPASYIDAPDASSGGARGGTMHGQDDAEALAGAAARDAEGEHLPSDGVSRQVGVDAGDGGGEHTASAWRAAGANGGSDGVTPPPEPAMGVRGVAADNRRERRRLLERLARSVLTTNDRQMISAASQFRHKAEECHDCNPQHDLDRAGRLVGATYDGVEASVPIWVERQARQTADSRIAAAHRSGTLGKFASLLMSLAELFNVPCVDRVHIFEEDTQTVAFNGGALFFNLRYFVTEDHASNWEEALCFWTVSFAHELAHFESVVHDRQHGRAMENAQRAMLPGLPRMLSRPWGLRPGHQPSWRLQREDAVAMR